MKKNQNQKPSPPQPPLSLRKRILFGAVMICLPILLLLGAEVMLRLCGYGGNDPVIRKAGVVPGGDLMITDQAGAISYFFANRSRPGYNDQYQFVSPKPTNVFRIFIVGESAAKGYPQPRILASSAFLKKMLVDAWPDRNVEVINLGTTAVASFPVLGMMTEALAAEPDLIIIHTGHNEFFGAYGVNSISRGGAGIARLKATRWVRSLALVQVLNKWLVSEERLKGKSLMEIMAAQSYTAPDDSVRQDAAHNLGANLREMVARCRSRGVPALVCTMPSNERDFFPVGEDRFNKLSPDQQTHFQALFRDGESLLMSAAPAALAKLTEALTLDPKHARAHFLSGRAFFSLSQTNDAQREFDTARDCDSMPWRATSLQQAAIRAAAAQPGGQLCDLQTLYRAHSPGGCIGWELMDDHVHPTLRGQALMAEGIVASLRHRTDAAGVTTAQFARIRPWEQYATELGDNPYDHYAVDHTMRILFGVSFMRERNAEAWRRFNDRATAFETTLTPEVMAVIREWQSEVPHAGGKRPITGMVAREFMREKRFAEALQLYEIAQRAVPEYTSWHMEYVYFTLACREKLAGQLSDAERKLALAEIEQGKFLLQRGFSQTGLTERYVGRLYQLRGEFAEAIPFLNASRQKLGGFDLVAAEQALFVSLIKTGQQKEARQLAANGVAKSGQYAPLYQQLLDMLDQKPTAKTPE
jgi:tetratricopeptide (TPR) repeat protein